MRNLGFIREVRLALSVAEKIEDALPMLRSRRRAWRRRPGAVKPGFLQPFFATMKGVSEKPEGGIQFEMRSAAGMIAAALAVGNAVLANGSRDAQTADPLAPGAGGADSAKSDAAPAAADRSRRRGETTGRRPRHAEGGTLPVDGAQRPLRRHGGAQGRRGGGLKRSEEGRRPARLRPQEPVVHLKRVKDCLYDIHAHFADEADTESQTGVDLCKDKKHQSDGLIAETAAAI